MTVSAAIALLSVSQVYQKLSARRLHQRRGSQVRRLVKLPEFRWAIVFLGLGTAVWLVALTRLEVSRAFPLLSLQTVVVVLVARRKLGEEIVARRWAGICLVVIGAMMICAA